jgi:hypothetical protein
LLQIVATAVDSIGAYGPDAAGWSQPSAIKEAGPGPVPLFIVASNLPPTIDALCKFKTTLYRHFCNILLFSGIYCTAFLYLADFLILQDLFRDQHENGNIRDLHLHIACKLST